MTNIEYAQLLKKQGINIKTVSCQECIDMREDFRLRLQEMANKAGSNHIVAPLSPLFPICKECRYEDRKIDVLSTQGKREKNQSEEEYNGTPDYIDLYNLHGQFI